MFIIIGQSLPSRLVTQKLTLQKSQIIIVAIMKHMEEDVVWLPREIYASVCGGPSVPEIMACNEMVLKVKGIL